MWSNGPIAGPIMADDRQSCSGVRVVKVLFISGGDFPDYQCDMLFHGLRTLFGAAIVDANRIAHMYRADYPEDSRRKRELYGRGFTLFGLLGSDDAVDRDDVPAKIARQFYDLVIFGSVRRCQTFIHDVLDHYPSDRVAFVDGEDDQLIAASLLGRGLYFKRELNAAGPWVAPIQFAIPAEKIAADPQPKTKVQAYVDPRDTRTYIYDTEPAYYADYAESLFGFTMKKAGWDCLRHYEIMANGCIPNFEDIQSCPVWTMMSLPKFELTEARNALLQRGPDFFAHGAGREAWERLNARIQTVLRRHLTTAALATSVIDAMRRGDGRPPRF